MQWKNRVTELLRIGYPIVQAPMLGVTTPEMVAAISNEGGLGSLPVGGLSPEKTVELIRKTRSLTKAPIALNLFLHDIPPADENEFERMQDFLERLCVSNHIDFKRRSLESFRFHSYTEQLEIILDKDIPVVSFTFGALPKDTAAMLSKKGIVLIGTATCLEEAKILDQAGVDIITAQGIEAGGHRGTFLNDRSLPMMGSVFLVPEIAAHTNRPILAAGGIGDGKGIIAALKLGASGVQPGSVFIASDESLAIPSYKKAIREATDTDSVLTRAFSGRWARGLKNKLIMEVEQSRLPIPAYPIQNGLLAAIRTAAQQQDNKDFTTLWAGQSAHTAEAKPAAEIFKQLIMETEALS